MADLINSVESGFYVLVAIMDEGSYNITENAYLALESIGSNLCRQVGYREAWAIVGKKGAPAGSVKEQHLAVGMGVAAVQDTMINYFTTGSISSPPIGPANAWYDLMWNQNVDESGTHIAMDVIGFNKQLSQWDTLRVGISYKSEKNLSFIPASTYPLIRLHAVLTDDDGLNTPYLHDWLVSYAQVADPAIGREVVEMSSDSLMEGDVMNIDLKVYNVGMTIADSVVLRFLINHPDSGKARLFEDKILTNIPVDSFRTTHLSWDPMGSIGNHKIFIELDPDDLVNELSETNNYFAEQVQVFADTVKPQIQVTYNGKQIVEGDYVSNTPVILINVYDNSRFLAENDTTKINLFLDNSRISYAANENNLTISPIDDSDEPKLKAQVRFTPELKDGDHSLEIFVKDARNNLTYHRDDFQVTSEFKIFNVFNYPNPFSDGTEFTFHLTQPSDKVMIKIYTVAGRLLRKLEYHHLEAGFHFIYWNGLDQDRNKMANGVYLYKIVARARDKHVEQIEKLVIMR